eukprot:197772-Pyramimonas_sp.AAC.1
MDEEDNGEDEGDEEVSTHEHYATYHEYEAQGILISCRRCTDFRALGDITILVWRATQALADS